MKITRIPHMKIIIRFNSSFISQLETIEKIPTMIDAVNSLPAIALKKCEGPSCVL
jgi:hypothetical protein